MAIDPGLRRHVIERAGNRCEYCRMPAPLDCAPFQIDHVRAQKHHGPTSADNLAWACFPCNNHKATNLAGIDPETGAMTRLFNPREDEWEEHFGWEGSRLVGNTAIGRATIDVLAINHPNRVALRQELLAEGVFL
jgi:hypothetical protein